MRPQEDTHMLANQNRVGWVQDSLKDKGPQMSLMSKGKRSCCGKRDYYMYLHLKNHNLVSTKAHNKM